jgi:hypothetical protein
MRYCLTITAAIGLLFEGAMGAATLSFDQSSLTVNSGQSFSLDVTISGVSDLADYEFDIGYQPTILKVLSVQEGPFLATAGPTLYIPGTISNSSGQVSSIADGIQGSGKGASGSGTLVKVNFKAIGQGMSNVTLFDVTLLDHNLSGITAQTVDSQVTVNGLSGSPEPSSLPLMCGAMICWTFIGRRVGKARRS